MLRRHLPFLILVFLSLGCFTAAGWLKWKGRTIATKREGVVSSYQTQILPKYLMKKIVMEKLLQEAQIQDAQISGILLHIPSWTARSWSDIQDMEELNSGLDTWFSAHLAKLGELQKKDERVKASLADLRKIEGQISIQKTELLSRAK